MSVPKLAYTVAEAAEQVGYSRDVIRQAIRDKALIAHYPTSKPVIRHADLDAWVENSPTERAS